MRPTLTQPSSTLRATMHTQKKRKNISFRLQRELCLWSLFFSVSPFSSPPVTPAPIMTMRNQQAVHRQRSSPSVFLLLPLLSPFLSYTSLFLCFFLAASFHRQLAVAAEVVPFLIFFLFFDTLEIYISTMTASYMTLCSCSLPFPSNQTPKHMPCPICSNTPTNTYHNSHQHGA